MGLIDKLQSKIELYRLEKRYTRRKNRPAFSTGAHYVDGEYVYSYEPSHPSNIKKGNKSADSSNTNSSSSSPVSLSKNSTGNGMGRNMGGEREFWRAPEERARDQDPWERR